MRGSGKRKPVSEINVVPYIDVMLVLLIIFMITAPLLQQGVEIDLPQASANPISPDQREPLIVSVSKAGDLYLNIGEGNEKPIDEETLGKRVAAVMNNDYGRVTEAMVLLQAAGVEKVGLMTESLDQ